MTLARILPLMIAALLAAGAAAAQTVATGAGRENELAEGARIDAYLSDASAAPSPQTLGLPSPGETASSAVALGRRGALPPMAADSPWARGVVGPITGPSPLATADAAPPPCDHRIHGEAGAEIGTGGERGGYGVGTLPVGKTCDAYVTVGVGTERGPRWRGRSGELTDASVRVDAPNFSLGISGVSGRGGPGFGGPAF